MPGYPGEITTQAPWHVSTGIRQSHSRAAMLFLIPFNSRCTGNLKYTKTNTC